MDPERSIDARDQEAPRRDEPPIRAERTLLRRIARNGAWLFAEQALRAVVGAVVGAIVARHLGPADFGTLAVVFAYLALFASAAGLGLPSVVVRDLVREPSDRPAILGGALELRLIATVLVTALGLGAVAVIEGGSGRMVALVAVACGALLFQCAEVVDFLFQAELRGRDGSIARGTGFLLASAARLSFVLLGAPLILFAAAPVIESAAAALLLAALLLSRSDDRFAWRRDPPRMRRMLRDAAPVAVSGFMVIGIMQFDRLILDRLADAHAVGVYSAASLLSAAWYAAPVIVGASVAPALTALHRDQPREYERKLAEVFGAVSGMALAVGLLGTVLAGPLVHLFFGGTFDGAAPVLAIHIWTGVFVAHVSIRTRALMIEGGERTVMRLSMGTLAANIVLNLVLVPRFGAVGAAWASLLAWGAGAALWPLMFPASRRFAAHLLRALIPSSWWAWTRSSTSR